MNYKILFELKKFQKQRNKSSKINFSSVFFTDQKRCGDLGEIIKNLPKNSAVIFREYDLSKEKRQVLALEIFAICKKFGHKFLVAKDLKLAQEIGANGLHFSDLDAGSNATFKAPENFKNNRKFIISLACHSLKSTLKAQKSIADLIFLSPIFATKSHLNAKKLGLKTLAKACRSSQKPICALGGINENNISSVRKSKACGIGGIDIFVKK